MVKVWAEKEFRNLKRIYQNGIPCPEPIELKSHVLVMEYLTKGDGQPSPKLKDYPFKDVQDIVNYYHKMLFYMRRLYQECRLVHADLSSTTRLCTRTIYILLMFRNQWSQNIQWHLIFENGYQNVNDFSAEAK